MYLRLATFRHLEMAVDKLSPRCPDVAGGGFLYRLILRWSYLAGWKFPIGSQKRWKNHWISLEKKWPEGLILIGLFGANMDWMPVKVWWNTKWELGRAQQLFKEQVSNICFPPLAVLLSGDLQLAKRTPQYTTGADRIVTLFARVAVHT